MLNVLPVPFWGSGFSLLPRDNSDGITKCFFFLSLYPGPGTSMSILSIFYKTSGEWYTMLANEIWFACYISVSLLVRSISQPENSEASETRRRASCLRCEEGNSGSSMSFLPSVFL